MAMTTDEQRWRYLLQQTMDGRATPEEAVEFKEMQAHRMRRAIIEGQSGPGTP